MTEEATGGNGKKSQLRLEVPYWAIKVKEIIEKVKKEELDELKKQKV